MAAKKAGAKAPAAKGRKLRPAHPSASRAAFNIPFLIHDDDYATIAQAQRVFFAELADRIAEGEALSGLDAWLAAGALKAFARQIPTCPRRARGQPHRVDHGEIALRIAACWMGARQMSFNAAYAHLAEAYGVSEQTVKNAWKAHGQSAVAFFESMGVEKPHR